MDRAATAEELDELEGRINRWLEEQLAPNPVVAAVARDESDERRWFARLRGEEKDTFTIWFTLRERTLHYETYVMPAPGENHERFFDNLLRRSLKLVGGGFALGQEEIIFPVGQLKVEFIHEYE